MVLADDSPLRHLPAELNKPQLCYLDGIRYCIDMAFLAYSRLQQTLWRVATPEQHPDSTQGNVDYAAAFLDAWVIVDVIHRLRELLASMPGVKQRGPAIQLFMRNTALVPDLRNIMQHLRSEVPVMIEKDLPVWGILSWYTILDMQTLSGRTCTLFAGRMPNKVFFPLPNPINRVFRSNVDHIILYCKHIQLELSTCVRAVERVTKSLEKEIRPLLKDTRGGSSDICLIMNWRLEGPVQVIDGSEGDKDGEEEGEETPPDG